MRTALILIAILLPSSALAAPIAAQRALFQKLDTAAQQGELSAHQPQLAQLAHYPLYPYLLAAGMRWRLVHNPGPDLDAEIATYLDTYRKLPPARSLRYAWILNLADRERWDTVIAQVTPGDDTRLQCLATTARIRTQAAGQKVLIAEGLRYWQLGHSQPERCDPIFAWLDKVGALTPKRIVARAHLAVLSGHYGLARYLARKLSDDNATPIKRWLNLAVNPGDLHLTNKLAPDLAVYVFKRLALRDIDGAGALIPQLRRRLHLSAADVYQMRRYVALLYAQEHKPQAVDWFQRLDRKRMGEFARAWQIRAAIMQQRWQAALQATESLPADQADQEVWRYWRARALAALGHRNAADRIYAKLADNRSYHGYLAADQLHRHYRLNRDNLKVDRGKRHSIEALPGVRRARELHALDRNHDARVEWNQATKDMNPAMLRQAALLAHKWGWYPIAIITLARSHYWDDLRIRYPKVYRDQAQREAGANGLDPAYVLAITRTESLFAPEAHSRSGAIGLMQLLPGTAARVARELGLPRPNRDALKQPDLNIRLGSRYLADMLQRFGGHLALATAAYNAGPHRVDHWLPASKTPADIWIENIPYTETRLYVQRAMSHMVVFQEQLDPKIIPLAERLSPVPTAAMLDNQDVAANSR